MQCGSVSHLFGVQIRTRTNSTASCGKVCTQSGRAPLVKRTVQLVGIHPSLCRARTSAVRPCLDALLTCGNAWKISLHTKLSGLRCPRHLLT